MSRVEKILRHIKKEELGVEIGPSHNPIASKIKGYKVHIIDHMTRDDLIEKYRAHDVNIDNIEEVDFVWEGENYLELTGGKRDYGWIIASHVIEHTPDLIGFLNECDSILKDDGVISLVIPDKRYCFDHFRPITGLSKIIDSHLQKRTMHTPGTVVEYCLNVVSKGGNIAWDASVNGDYHFMHSLDDAKKGMEVALDKKEYIDVHSWCFVPHSFRLMIQDLFNLGLIPFQEIEYCPTVGCEFFMTLSRSGKGIEKSRLEIVELIKAEMNT
jgi:predicted SAM-dependent methyltransferase